MYKFERKIVANIKKHLSRKEITVITGARQTGKTTVLKQIEKFLSEKGETSYLLTLEDPLLLNNLNEHPEKIFQFIRLNDKKIYLMLDEIQYLDNPSNFLKLIFDKYEQQIKLIVTGSSAFYIDTKFSDSLTGRKQIFELYPLDFEEFLVFKEKEELIIEWQEIRNSTDYISHKRNQIQSLFDEYLTYGGYPAVVLEKDINEKKFKLKELFSSYLKRDVLEAGVQNQDKFFNLITLLANQCGSLLNTNEISNTLKLSVTAVEHYLYILRKTYHIKLVRPFYTNIRKELTKMPKVFFNDLGFRNIIINRFSPIPQRLDRGIVAENFVFIRLRQLYDHQIIKYWRTSDGNEIDFIIPQEEAKGVAIEVKFSQSEYKALKYKKFTVLYPDFHVICKAFHADKNENNILAM